MKTHKLSLSLSLSLSLGKAYEDLDSTIVIVIFLLTQQYNNCSEIHHGCRVWAV